MPGELALTARSQVRLTGTRTGWDGLYMIDRLERHLSTDGGFVQHLTCRSAADGTVL